MSLLIESIRCQDGGFHNLMYHQRRVDHAFRSLCRRQQQDLTRLLESVVHPAKGWWKCRVQYGGTSARSELTPYTPRRIETLLAVHVGAISYTRKLRDRR